MAIEPLAVALFVVSLALVDIVGAELQHAIDNAVGFEVREERLLREVGYRVRSGSCRVRDKHVTLLDRGLPVGAQIDILVDELAGRSLEDLYLSPAARSLLEGAAASQANSSVAPAADASSQAAQ
jgi:hypothetical protein